MLDCFAVKNSFWIDPQGHTRPCGRFKGKLSHISNFESFSDVNSSPDFVELQNKLSNDQWPDGCIRCKEDEEKNLNSKRSFYPRIGLGSEDFMVDISMGNFCNLKCRMCGPHNSTQWQSDYKALGLEYKDKTYVLSENDIEKLKEHLKQVKGNILIELKGGEPLIMPQTEYLVKELLTLDNVNKIALLIVTNGTSVPSWVEEHSEKFREVKISVSVDGLDEIYNYIRGTKSHSFDECYENIIKFYKIPSVILRFNVVVQNLNVHQMVDIHTLLQEFSSKITYITLSGPAWYQISVLPKPIKEEIYNKFLQNKEKFGRYQEQMENVHKLLISDCNDEHWQKFVNITNALDKLRGQNILEALPSLSPYWK